MNMDGPYLERLDPEIKPLFSSNAVREEFFAIASIMKLRRKICKRIRQCGIYSNNS